MANRFAQVGGVTVATQQKRESVMRQEYDMRALILSLVLLGCVSVSAETARSEKGLADRLVQLMDVASTVAGSAEVTADAMISQNPTLKPYKSVIMEWFGIAFAEAAFESKIAEVYSAAFSETELREMIGFYETPTGQRLIEMQPELFRKGAAIGRQLGEEKSGLLQEMIATRAAELERLGQ
ncbi:MAG: hypothetical protein CL908_02530 [Deltaproteobacteria bacterium]|nr:hypothetical protein [Deltaproteobacteria bacterium]